MSLSQSEPSLVSSPCFLSLFPLLSEFVEVILLPLDEFQVKIDGEASGRI